MNQTLEYIFDDEEKQNSDTFYLKYEKKII